MSLLETIAGFDTVIRAAQGIGWLIDTAKASQKARLEQSYVAGTDIIGTGSTRFYVLSEPNPVETLPGPQPTTMIPDTDDDLSVEDSLEESMRDLRATLDLETPAAAPTPAPTPVKVNPKLPRFVPDQAPQKFTRIMAISDPPHFWTQRPWNLLLGALAISAVTAGLMMVWRKK